jgi:hydroxymethylbilane synthase
VNWRWQAHTVENKLKDLGYKTKIVAVKSTGDIILDKLYELGITGIFTKTLDVAMINGDVDIAVHSMKMFTALPVGIVQPFWKSDHLRYFSSQR